LIQFEPVQVQDALNVESKKVSFPRWPLGIGVASRSAVVPIMIIGEKYSGWWISKPSGSGMSRVAPVAR
jgi:hypothetical protein